MIRNLPYRYAVFLLLALLLTGCSRDRKGEVLLPHRQGFLRLQVLRDDIVRVTVSPVKELQERPSLMIAGDPAVATRWRRSEDDTSLVITTARLQVSVDKRSGRVRFSDRHGHLLLTADSSVFLPVRIPDEEKPVFTIRQHFLLTPGEALYGLGQYQDGVMNWRGHDCTLLQENTVAVNPFLVSTKNYGILWDNYSLTRFHDSAGGTFLQSRVADAIDYYFVAGDDPDGVIAGYRHLTGQAPLFGRWAYGYWQSKERYHNQYEPVAVVREYRRRRLPLDNIVQDWMYWGRLGWNALDFDTLTFPRPRAMIDSIHALNTHIMISVWPNFGTQTRVYREMRRRGFLITNRQGGSRGLYDPYNPAARRFYWHWLDSTLFSRGIDAWWLDATEPEVTGATVEEKARNLEQLGTTALGPMARYLNSYSLMTCRAVYEGQRQTTDRKRVFLLTRSSYAGQQRYGAVTWSGDIHARWDVLRHQIAAGINFCLAGIPYWTTDIGAFLPDNPLGNRDNAYRELYLRWYQFGTFCPIFRSHGSGTAREIYRFGEEGSWCYEALARFDRLRYRLLPYIYSLAWQVTDNSYTLMRGLVMDFPEDTAVREIGDEYMFGPAFLVTPVTEKMYFAHNYTGRVIAPQYLTDTQGRRGGLTLTFYNGTAFDTLAARNRIRKLDVDWNDGVSRPPQVHQYHYSIRMEGSLTAPVSGTYTFVTTSNDGIRVKVGGHTVVENWTPHGATIDMGDITLQAGQRYPLTVEYFQTLGSAVTRIAWILPPERDTLRQQQVPPAKDYPVYLPQGTRWYDFWRGTAHAGGETLRVPAPPEETPLFVRAGTLLPLGPVMQYATEKPADPIELRIYPGADGSFTLYEDENDNYDYEKGMYATITFTWDDKENTLTIGKRKGSFPGMLRERTFRIVKVRKGHGTGPEVTEQTDRTVGYKGKKIRITIED